MTTNVLVAYATRNGSTAEVAAVIADALRGEGLRAEARQVTDRVDVSAYNAVVLGSGVYAGRWLRDAHRFVRREHHALVRLPVWLFSSGPLDRSASERDIPPVPGAFRIARRLGVEGHVTFGGCLKDGARGRVARMLLKQGRGGDFRDQGQIRSWARDIAHELVAERVGP
ncbi:flavodoxin domain-containing protein [Streptomyces sp. NPDC058001]|uniref:flavodoxin domain-containing protein n=1 Tax=Streptomyces sp. NPDC058001 TaxID=3346300 RepID=UPI0036E6D5E6